MLHQPVSNSCAFSRRWNRGLRTDTKIGVNTRYGESTLGSNTASNYAEEATDSCCSKVSTVSPATCRQNTRACWWCRRFRCFYCGPGRVPLSVGRLQPDWVCARYGALSRDLLLLLGAFTCCALQMEAALRVRLRALRAVCWHSLRLCALVATVRPPRDSAAFW